MPKKSTKKFHASHVKAHVTRSCRSDSLGMSAGASVIAAAFLLMLAHGTRAVVSGSVTDAGQNAVSRQLVVSADAEVKPRSKPEATKPAAPKATGLKIEVLSGPTGILRYYPWTRGSVKAVASFDDGSSKDVPANWTVEQWYGKRQTFAVTGCENVSVCHLGGNFPQERSYLIAAYGGISAKEELRTYGTSGIAGDSPTYTDELPDWAKQNILDAGIMGIMRGYEDGRFGPADSVTNAQFAVITLRLAQQAGRTEKGERCPQGVVLPDGMTAEHFAYSAFCYFLSHAYDMNWAHNLGEPITRLQAAKMLSHVFAEPYFYERSPGLKPKSLYKDTPTDADTVRALYGLFAIGIIKGSDGMFRPNDGVNRAEAAVISMRTLEFALDTDH